MEDWVWSYSRVGLFDLCKYAFFLKYLYGISESPRFFSQYGSYNHLIFQKYYEKELEKSELLPYFLKNYRESITAEAPNSKISTNYIKQGIAYWNSFDDSRDDVLAVEKKMTFKVGNRKMVGIADLIKQNNDVYVVIDHKSKDLSARSKSGTTKKDKELDNYLRQLYLYSIPLKKEFNKFPNELKFNCFRTQKEISEPFKTEDFLKSQEWMLGRISEIENNENWEGDYDFFKCKYICGFCEICEYFAMFNPKGRC